jgi:2-oxoglutarate ferredoxin oxidoreductase subunit delta
MKGSIQINQELCKGCYLCIEFCPKGTISMTNKLNTKGFFLAQFDDKKGCTGCAMCAQMCPEIAIEVYRG